MELSDDNLTFVHMKDSNNILADVISRLKTLDIYKESLDNPKTCDIMTCTSEMVSSNIQILCSDKLHTKQKKDIHCRKLAAQLHHKNKNTFKPVMISPDGLLQKQQYVHGLNITLP